MPNTPSGLRLSPDTCNATSRLLVRRRAFFELPASDALVSRPWLLVVVVVAIAPALSPASPRSPLPGPVMLPLRGSLLALDALLGSLDSTARLDTDRDGGMGDDRPLRMDGIRRAPTARRRAMASASIALSCCGNRARRSVAVAALWYRVLLPVPPVVTRDELGVEGVAWVTR